MVHSCRLTRALHGIPAYVTPHSSFQIYLEKYHDKDISQTLSLAGWPHLLPPPLFPAQPYCSPATAFNGLSVDMLFDTQQPVDDFIQALAHNGGAATLIKELRVSVC